MARLILHKRQRYLLILKEPLGWNMIPQFHDDEGAKSSSSLI